MALIYSTIGSLDGYVEEAAGKFDWAAPDEEVHRFVNDLERRVGTYLYGRRMYDTMVYWGTADATENQPDYIQEYARIWQSADKVVFSRTLSAPSSDRTQIEHDFDPKAIERMKSGAARDISIGGAHLAAQALRAGLVDEYHAFVVPIIVGGGKRALPNGVRAKLELVDERRFGNGTVYLRYRVT